MLFRIGKIALSFVVVTLCLLFVVMPGCGARNDLNDIGRRASGEGGNDAGPDGPSCKGDGLGCTSASECCTSVCNNGLCGTGCSADGSPCSGSAECCDNNCQNGRCGGV